LVLFLIGVAAGAALRAISSRCRPPAFPAIHGERQQLHARGPSGTLDYFSIRIIIFENRWKCKPPVQGKEQDLESRPERAVAAVNPWARLLQ
jgi:hypothetical protein